MISKPIICICGKICTSSAGFTLHIRHCKDAIAAKKRGKKPGFVTDIIEQGFFLDEVQDLVDIVNNMAYDANNALLTGNKSAARRARQSLNIIRNKIIPLRKHILDKIKHDSI